MTRGEQILALVDEKEKELKNHSYTAVYTEGYCDGLFEGAFWADNNPNWHKCEDEMPEPNVKVLCYTSKGTYFVAWMEEQLIGHNQPTGEYRWSRWNTPIIAWTELPEPPKFD